MTKNLVVESREYHNLLLKKTTIIDVRAPIEFAAGAIPGAIICHYFPMKKDIRLALAITKTAERLRLS